jgi:tetratricopeptide (TPR) repeat protein
VNWIPWATSGTTVATGSYLIRSAAGNRVMQQNVFAVASNATKCAEIHISKTLYTDANAGMVDAPLQSFSFDSDYVPTAQDYFATGSLLYQMGQEYASAAVYYQRALDILPPSVSLNQRRVITDQLAMSYGISGQIKESRAVLEGAIKTDPDYPLNYYNLACADAEQGKASDAKIHLQQAFDRKANTIPGEHLPDPAGDDSIQKLKKNKEFWAFVQTLK